MATFKTKSGSSGAPGDPEQLYRLLSATNNGPEALWAHQADVLRAWHGKYLDKKDVAIELPTGSGKTMVGGLVAEYLRQKDNKPVAYLCPNNLLAHQTASKLRDYGIPVVELVGDVPSWNPADRTKFNRADAVAVSVYSHVFNSNPALTNAGLLVLDDAHGAEGYVAGPWKFEIRRSTHPNAYLDLLSTLRDALDPVVFGHLENAGSNLDARTVYLASPLSVAANAQLIEQALEVSVASNKVSSGAKHVWKFLRGRVDRCLVYVSASQVLIRPMIAPTFVHQAFEDPTRRVYMSATLGSGGELERAFGRRRITRIPIPKGWENQGTGRRFFIFPELTSDLASDPALTNAFVSGLMTDYGRALVLAPDEKTALKSIAERVPPDHVVMRAKDVIDDLAPFTSSAAAALVLANRYDGIDLPGKDCELVVLDGLPIGSDLQEQFLHSSVGAVTVLQERVRARIMQGSGRATRGARDRAVVVILRNDLISYLDNPGVNRAMHPEVQAELEFGQRNSMDDGTSSAELLELLELFKVNGEEWAAADRSIAEDRDKRVVVMPQDTEALQKAVKHEVIAWEEIWDGQWERALTSIRELLDQLTVNGAARRYSALWNYIGFVVARRLALQSGDETFNETAAGYFEEARWRAKGTSWFSSMTTPVERESVPAPPRLDPVDEIAMQTVLADLHDLALPETFNETVRVARVGLGVTDDHEPFEAALVTLGELAGATESYTYDDETEQAKPDAVWIFGEIQWVIWEAKSMATETGAVGPKEVQQAGGQLRTVEADRKAPEPGDTPCLLISRKPKIMDSARNLAEGHVFLVRPDAVADLFDRIVRAWLVLRSRGLSSVDSSAAAEIFRSEGALPSQWLHVIRESPLRQTSS
ncbi:DEAD/DEAH box helicase [Nocardia fluminea]|uniref:DEAD/DEAH box helicase n=1 Tax=Nocardia fluminea TaxID=134984 RepID=UPI00364774D5